MKTGHLLAAILGDGVCLDRTGAHRIDGLEWVAGAEQVFTAVHRAVTLYNPVQQFQVVLAQAHRQAQLEQAAVLAGDLEAGQIDANGTVLGHKRPETGLIKYK